MCPHGAGRQQFDLTNQTNGVMVFMVIAQAVRSVLEDYPKIFFACHRRHVRDDKARRTLSRHQASILDHLDEVEPLSLNALAAHMGVTASTMSLNVDRLVRDGYVLRQRNSTEAP